MCNKFKKPKGSAGWATEFIKTFQKVQKLIQMKCESSLMGVESGYSDDSEEESGEDKEDPEDDLGKEENDDGDDVCLDAPVHAMPPLKDVNQEDANDSNILSEIDEGRGLDAENE